MKYAKWMMALTLTLAPMLASAQLSSSQKLKADVPFEFEVGNRMIPAGECTVRTGTMDGKSIVVHNIDASTSLFSSISTDEMKTAAANYALVFNKYGDRYFLSGIKLEGSRVMHRLPQSKAEAELRAANVTSTQEILLASLQ